MHIIIQLLLFIDTHMAGCPIGFENMGGRGDLQNLMGGLYMGEHRGLKMLSKNTCEGVHLIVKLAAINLQACKFTKKLTSSHTFFKDFS